MISPQELEEVVTRLRHQGNDDGSTEAKACESELSKDVWESVSAFANTSGGLIICGLGEGPGFVPVPTFDVDRVRDQFVSGIGDGGQPSRVAPVPRYEMTRGVVDAHPVLLIQIEELGIREKPCFIRARGVQGGSYKRVDDKDIRLSPSELYEMQSVLIPSDADSAIVPEASVDDLDSDLIDKVIATRRKQTPRVLRGVETREGQLERLNITNKVGAVRLAGMLAVGLYPQQYYPKLVIDVAVHPGVRKSEPGAPRFIDRQICDGPLASCVEDALAAIGRNLRTISYVEGAGRRDEWEVPEEVLREAVANAVIHREYSTMFQGESVSVDIYPDRIEIANPGGLWGGKTVDTLGDGESRCRNAHLMSLMGAVPLGHAAGTVAESQGSGIPAMIREMESRSLGHPVFVAKNDSFRVILARHGAELERNRVWISAHTARRLSREEEILLALLREQGALDVSGIRERLGWDSDDIRSRCRSLVDEGLVADEGVDRFAPVEDVTEQVTSHAESERPRRRPAEVLREQIVAALSDGNELAAQELADMLHVSIARVRYALPKLIDEGGVVATAGAHSKNRRYRRAERAGN